MDSVKILKQELDKGASIEEALSFLRSQEFSPVQTIYAIHQVKNVGIGEAKEIFASSKAWHDVASEADDFHNEIIKALKNENKDL